MESKEFHNKDIIELGSSIEVSDLKFYEEVVDNLGDSLESVSVVKFVDCSFINEDIVRVLSFMISNGVREIEFNKCRFEVNFLGFTISNPYMRFLKKVSFVNMDIPNHFWEIMMAFAKYNNIELLHSNDDTEVDLTRFRWGMLENIRVLPSQESFVFGDVSPYEDIFGDVAHFSAFARNNTHLKRLEFKCHLNEHDFGVVLSEVVDHMYCLETLVIEVSFNEVRLKALGLILKFLSSGGVLMVNDEFRELLISKISQKYHSSIISL